MSVGRTFEWLNETDDLCVGRGRSGPFPSAMVFGFRCAGGGAEAKAWTRFSRRFRLLIRRLRRRAEDPQALIPHVYSNLENPKRPLLCLYDPEMNEWHAGCVVASTIVPWTIDWLACYEGWLATGRWAGGGRHPNGMFDV